MDKACKSPFMELLFVFPIKGYALSFDFSRVVNYAHPSYILDFPEKLSERIINNAKDFLEVTRKYLETFINE